MRRALVLAALLAGCPDYGLDSRRFVCATAVDCGPGWSCGADGFCARIGDAGPPDAAAPDAAAELCNNGRDDDGDGFVDCRDDECGVVSCDDHNPCTDDACLGDGLCRSESLADDAPCGPGCKCLGGVPAERACNNGDDDDGDGLRDCLDDDCPCMGDTGCCPDGSCSADCM